MKHSRDFSFILLVLILIGFSTADAQENIAQQAYNIFQQNCLNCHGEHGAFTEEIIIEHTALIETGAVVPGKPIESELYTRLLENDPGKRMPLGQPQLSAAAILTIGNWIQAGAPNWEVQHDVNFITTDAMLTAIQRHVSTLSSFDREYARYFTLTHLYNAGESPETLNAYKIALSKLVNSLSWGFEIINPRPIDKAETIFYIDLRHYEWEIRGNAWTQIEQVYPYNMEFEFDTPKQKVLREKLLQLRQEMKCEVPFVHVDWFLATASLPPLYHEILALPLTDRELEGQLEVNVARNLSSAPGVRVWRAGLNDSGVSNNNRVVERHTSRYGAYWKSYDFAGSVGAQNVFTHPLSFTHDGGEVVFNLPNGLQAYYISDASGNRIDVAPTTIVSNPAASDPAVRNGLSCIGCHTEGMKEFEDGVRAVIQQQTNPPFDKAQALRLYAEKPVMDALVAEDTARYKTALEATGGVLGGIEPVHRFYEAFHGPVDAVHAAASVGLATEAFLQEIRDKSSLQRLGLLALTAKIGNVKRDAWTSRFPEIVEALHTDDNPTLDPVPIRRVRPTGSTVHIPDTNLRAAIAETLGKAPNALITGADMERLTRIVADEREIRDLTGLEHATRLERIEFRHNEISGLSPLAGLTRLNNIKLRGNRIRDVSPLAGLINVDWLGLEENAITDLSPLKGLIKLGGIGIEGNPVLDVSPLAGLLSLEGIRAWNTPITDFSPLAGVPRLRWLEVSENMSLSSLSSFSGLKSLRRLEIHNCGISDLSGLEALTQLTSLKLRGNLISDVSPLAKLTGLKELELQDNIVTNVSPLAALRNLERLNLTNNAITDFSPLEKLPEKTNIEFSHNPGFPSGGPKIVGPWLWVLIPGAGFDSFRSTDLLAQESGGKATELGVATNGAMTGTSIGESVWTSHKLSTNWNNLRKMVNDLGMSVGSDQQRVVYGSVILDSPRKQETKMFAGSDDNHKVWLNGELVNENYQWANDYQTFFPVTLQQGKNALLVAVHDWGGGFHGFFGFAPDAEYTVLATGHRFTFATESPQVKVGETFTLRLNSADVTDFAGWQGNIAFNPSVLKANRVSEGSFLKQGGGRTFFEKGTINNPLGEITGVKAARLSEGAVNGQGTLLSVSFTAKAAGKSRLRLRNFQAGTHKGEAIPFTPSEFIIVVEGGVARPAWDVNEDGVTDADDLLMVTVALRQDSPENPRTDVNGDGVVDGKDAALVAEHLGEGEAPAAPSSVLPVDLTAEAVRQALDILCSANDGSRPFQRGIARLEALLGLFVPEQTVLLANYPNPFNPETWIPYHLANPSEVVITIYDAHGRVVRRLELGHQQAGYYTNRSRAAYWDGRNYVGERVASGIYFYQLQTDEMSLLRKMVILK